MVACTALSAPIMFISAWCLTYTSMTANIFIDDVISTNKDVTIVAVICAVSEINAVRFHFTGFPECAEEY